MDKRYQIFISSTFLDLEKERAEILRTLQKMKQMPVAMEGFSASPEKPFAYIQREINESDYFILIIGSKYGSTCPETGLSYTEMEYDYAIEKNIPILVFEKSPIENNEPDAEVCEKLEIFRKKAKAHLVKQWHDIDGLQKEIILSLNEASENFPQKGWVRGSSENSTKRHDLKTWLLVIIAAASGAAGTYVILTRNGQNKN